MVDRPVRRIGVLVNIASLMEHGLTPMEIFLGIIRGKGRVVTSHKNGLIKKFKVSVRPKKGLASLRKIDGEWRETARSNSNQHLYWRFEAENQPADGEEILWRSFEDIGEEFQAFLDISWKYNEIKSSLERIFLRKEGNQHTRLSSTSAEKYIFLLGKVERFQRLRLPFCQFVSDEDVKEMQTQYLSAFTSRVIRFNNKLNFAAGPEDEKLTAEGLVSEITELEAEIRQAALLTEIRSAFSQIRRAMGEKFKRPPVDQDPCLSVQDANCYLRILDKLARFHGSEPNFHEFLHIEEIYCLRQGYVEDFEVRVPGFEFASECVPIPESEDLSGEAVLNAFMEFTERLELQPQ